MPQNITEDIIHAFDNRTQRSLRELLSTQRAYTAEPNVQNHGAFALAIAEARRLLLFSDSLHLKLRKQQQQSKRKRRHQEQTADLPSELPHSTSALEPLSSSGDVTIPDIPSALLLQLDERRQELRRRLSHSVSLLEEARHEPGDPHRTAGPPTDDVGAADAAASLRSLLHTRTMLLTELQKVESTVQQLATSSETLGLVQHSLREVHAGMAQAQQLVRRLLAVQSRDDLLLRLSVVVFVTVVGYILLQRVGRFFPVVEYVTVV
ncbi:unnamed protein product [Phytomonas sp. EM1]|nr:unnamed protein product [Phytomonas sp. EM1]|eukprot:CCW60441.1 unnamed protein product [Phytomonas sp. isolate EM1]